MADEKKCCAYADLQAALTEIKRLKRLAVVPVPAGGAPADPGLYVLAPAHGYRSLLNHETVYVRWSTSRQSLYYWHGGTEHRATATAPEGFRWLAMVPTRALEADNG